MPISDAVVKLVKYPPELLPDSWYGNIPAGAEVAPPVLELRNFRPYLVRLTNIQVPTAAPTFVNLRAQYNNIQIEENVDAMLSLFPGAWQMVSKDNLRFNFFSIVGVIPYTAHYGLWVTKPTIAEKMVWNITLTPEDRALADKLGIAATVEKGLLPLPITQQIEREYQVLAEETHSRQVTIAVANTVYSIENIYPRPGEIIVLTRIAALPAAVGDVVRVIVARDRDEGIADVRTFPLSLIPGGEVACFIPATTEMRLTCQAAVAPAGAFVPMLFRYTFQRIRLTNILRARFGLVSKDELPGDVYEKVLSGVL